MNDIFLCKGNTNVSEAGSEDSAYRTDSNASIVSYCDMNIPTQLQSNTSLLTPPSSLPPPVSRPLSAINKFQKKHSKSHLSCSMDALNKIYTPNKEEQFSSFLTPPVPKRTISLERSAILTTTVEEDKGSESTNIDRDRPSTFPIINSRSWSRYNDPDKSEDTTELPILSPDSPLSPNQLHMWNMLRQQQEKNKKHRSGSKEFNGPAFHF